MHNFSYITLVIYFQILFGINTSPKRFWATRTRQNQK